MNEYFSVDPEAYEMEKGRLAIGEAIQVENGFSDTDYASLYRYYKNGWNECVTNTDQIFLFS